MQGPLVPSAGQGQGPCCLLLPRVGLATGHQGRSVGRGLLERFHAEGGQESKRSGTLGAHHAEAMGDDTAERGAWGPPGRGALRLG